MKGFAICLLLLALSVSVSNTQTSLQELNPGKKLFVITLDGFRWQELFNGADSALINDVAFTADTAFAKALFWSPKQVERRKKLLPFMWNVLAKNGQLFGNRSFDNKVNVANPYALSYPGYNELLTGSVDLTIWSNGKHVNANKSFLQTLNQSKAYKGKVAAFTSWSVFPFILNEGESSFVQNSGHQKIEGHNLTAGQMRVNALQANIDAGERRETRYDELTYIACKEYVLQHKPSIVFLSFSGTDDAAHEKNYSQYLQQANKADRMIGELWNLVQTIPEYAGTTTFIITTDHGRGKRKDTWHNHGFFVGGSSQTWLALLGNSIVPRGEMTANNQVYLKDVKALATQLLAQQ